MVRENMNLPVPILSALVGAIVLFFGRKLFWLCVAAVGFAAGIELAPLIAHEPSSLLALSLALVLGFLGAILALFLQKLAIAVFGFVAGGKLAMALSAAFLAPHAMHPAVIFVIGGVIGALLLLSLFDWALILLSSIVGAYLIENAVVLPPMGMAVVFVLLVAVGILIQSASFQRARTATTP